MGSQEPIPFLLHCPVDDGIQLLQDPWIMESPPGHFLPVQFPFRGQDPFPESIRQLPETGGPGLFHLPSRSVRIEYGNPLFFQIGTDGAFS